MEQLDAVKQFIDQIRWLYEPEFGDFKRKVNLYIQCLEESQPSVKTGAGKSVLENMKNIVVFSPNGDIESTRREVIQLAAQLLGTSGGPLH
jgi:hypothetical protein